MDAIKDTIGNKLNKDSQPGNGVESAADNSVNQEVNKVAGEAGIPQQADSTIDQAVDSKVNSEIPGGN